MSAWAVRCQRELAVSHVLKMRADAQIRPPIVQSVVVDVVNLFVVRTVSQDAMEIHTTSRSRIEAAALMRYGMPLHSRDQWQVAGVNDSDLPTSQLDCCRLHYEMDANPDSPIAKMIQALVSYLMCAPMTPAVVPVNPLRPTSPSGCVLPTIVGS